VRTVFRYVSRTYLQLFAGIFLTILTIFLMTDFVDRAKSYTGPNWVLDVAELYAWKAVLVAQQLAPAALLLGAGAAVSVIRKRGELTALDALAFGPRAVYVPVAVWTAVLCVAFVAFDELAVVKAGPKVDEITTTRFKRWGDWRFFFQPKQWFRLGDRIYYLRAGDADAGFRDVTVLQLTSEFELQGRIDADSMHFVQGTTWRLLGVTDRAFLPGGRSEVRTAPEQEYDLGAPGNAFRIRKGRPEQMRLPMLLDQIDARAEVGLPTQQFRLALHNRFAYPLAGFPAALLAVGLALRRERKGHLTTALLEGLAIALGLWGVMVVCKTLVLSERLSPAVAAWTPLVALVAAAGFVFLRNDARFQRRPAAVPSARR
jgi:lipopolysaccharide export system permease protein